MQIDQISASRAETHPIVPPSAREWLIPVARSVASGSITLVCALVRRQPDVPDKATRRH